MRSKIKAKPLDKNIQNIEKNIFQERQSNRFDTIVEKEHMPNSISLLKTTFSQVSDQKVVHAVLCTFLAPFLVQCKKNKLGLIAGLVFQDQSVCSCG